jgi:hypothetical protein
VRDDLAHTPRPFLLRCNWFRRRRSLYLSILFTTYHLFTYSKQINSVNKTTRVIESATKSLSDLTGLDARFDLGTQCLVITHADQSVVLPAVVIERLSRSTLAEFIDVYTGAKTLVITPTLSREQMSHLQEAGFNYLDTTGNVYITAEGLVVRLQGVKPAPSKIHIDTSGRAFQQAGLKVLFTLLVDPARVNETYRDLADRVDVSAATVKYVHDDLERRGNVIKIGRGRGMRRRLVGTADLARRWASTYGDTLRPRLVRGRYRFLDANRHKQWKDLRLNAPETCWGGETAASMHAGNLRPEILTIYTRADISDLAKSLRIVPADEGQLEILKKFWDGDVDNRCDQPTVPILMAYADLLASGETRNLEAADRLYEEWAGIEIDK